MSLSSLIVWIFLTVVCWGLPPGTSPATQLFRRIDSDPGDLSWIKAWASVGDSYSSGIGSGKRKSGWGDWGCSRYDASFPAIINADPRLGDPTSRTFTHWACSGAATDRIINTQVVKLADSSQDLITITSGGNDLDLRGILNECVYQWLSAADPITSKCQGEITKAQHIVDSNAFRRGLDKLIATAKTKLKPGGHIYYVGYATVFGTDDNQCDDITWAQWYEIGKREYLTLDKRIKMNALVKNINKAISDAVSRAGSAVTFIDYDKYFAQSKGRFCEKGYPETSPNRWGLLLYERYTDDDVPPTSGQMKQADEPPSHVTPGLVMNGTFEGAINDYIRQMHEKHPSWGSDWINVQETGPSIESIKATDEQIVRGFSSSLLPDSIGKIFHPRPNGHQMIANLVIYHISANYAKKVNKAWPAEEITSGTCAAAKGSPNQLATGTPQKATQTVSPTSTVETSTEASAKPSSKSPSQPSPQPTPENPPMPSCHAAFKDHINIHPWAVSLFASRTCEEARKDGLAIKEADKSSYIHKVLFFLPDPDQNSYVFDVFWQDGCTSDVTQRNAFNPMDENYNCTSLFERGYNKCNNGGVGGEITVGCVTYGFSVGPRKNA